MFGKTQALGSSERGTEENKALSQSEKTLQGGKNNLSHSWLFKGRPMQDVRDYLIYLEGMGS